MTSRRSKSLSEVMPLFSLKGELTENHRPQRVCAWTHSRWERHRQGQTPGHSRTANILQRNKTWLCSQHWKHEAQSESTSHPKLSQTIQSRIINYLTSKRKEETDIILVKTWSQSKVWVSVTYVQFFLKIIFPKIQIPQSLQPKRDPEISWVRSCVSPSMPPQWPGR